MIELSLPGLLNVRNVVMLLMVRPSFPVPSIQAGDTVAICLSRHVPVYECDGVQVISRYCTISVTPVLSVVEGQNA